MSYDDQYDISRRKPFTTVGLYISEQGRSRQRIRCPHCHTEFNVFHWSFRARGKKCPACGAMHHAFGEHADPVRGS